MIITLELTRYFIENKIVNHKHMSWVSWCIIFIYGLFLESTVEICGVLDINARYHAKKPDYNLIISNSFNVLNATTYFEKFVTVLLDRITLNRWQTMWYECHRDNSPCMSRTSQVKILKTNKGKQWWYNSSIYVQTWNVSNNIIKKGCWNSVTGIYMLVRYFQFWYHYLYSDKRNPIVRKFLIFDDENKAQNGVWYFTWDCPYTLADRISFFRSHHSMCGIFDYHCHSKELHNKKKIGWQEILF